jgi:hypothetical protein
VVGYEAARLERDRGVPLAADALLNDQVGRRERVLNVARAHVDLRRDVAIRAIEQRRGGTGHRFAGVEQRGQRLVLELDLRRRVLRHVAALGDDDRDGLSGVADAVARQRRLEVPLHPGLRVHPDRDPGLLGHVGGGHHVEHVWLLARPAHVD